MPRSLTRRAFLGQASCAAVGSLGLLSTLLNLRMANSAVAQTLEPGEDYRALVCLFFAGGMDSYNLLMPDPGAGSAYDNYVVTRGGTYDAVTNSDGLALPAASIIGLAAHASDPFGFGVHPRCADDGARPGMASLYGQGDLAFVANVGTLAERLTKTTYNNSTGRRPSGLYSHSDQVQQWHTSVATEARTIGWAGRAADLLHAGNTSARVSMNISLAGNNVWQTGTSVFNYNISSTGSSLPSDYNSPYATPVVSATSRSATRTAAIDNLLQQEYQNLLTAPSPRTCATRSRPAPRSRTPSTPPRSRRHFPATPATRIRRALRRRPIRRARSASSSRRCCARSRRARNSGCVARPFSSTTAAGTTTTR